MDFVRILLRPELVERLRALVPEDSPLYQSVARAGRSWWMMPSDETWEIDIDPFKAEKLLEIARAGCPEAAAAIQDGIDWTAKSQQTKRRHRPQDRLASSIPDRRIY